MKRLLIAYLFIFIDIHITSGASRISLTPTFAGYILLLGAFKLLEGESPEFTRLRPFALGMAVYTGICWLLDAFGVTASPNGVSLPSASLSLIGTVVSLYIAKGVVEGIKDMEVRHDADLKAGRLELVWKVLAAAQIASIVMLVFPPLAAAAVIVSFISTIMFLIRLYDCKTALDSIAWRDRET